tara:strand:- start:896 stop:1174 length:279 start_codon:yes stop_codon:yes gene_type:complete
MTEEKDCTTEYFECESECDINDQECKDECVTDLKECDIDTTPDEGDLISELLTITSLLGGQMERKETLNSVGRSSKKIIIEYDIKQRDQRSS